MRIVTPHWRATLQQSSCREFLLGVLGLSPKLCCAIPGFLLFAIMLILLVAVCVSPSAFYMIAAS